MTPEDLRVDVAADPRLLGSVRALLRSYLTACGIAEDKSDEVVLAVDEACTNAIRHSYGGPCSERIELRLRCSDEGLEIVVADHGKPAPPQAVAPRDLPAPDPATVKPGGLGVHLMHRVFDRVEFRPGERSGNTVRMFLRRPDRVGMK